MASGHNLQRPNVLNMPYSNCNTRIVSLLDLNLPSSGTEQDYKRIYESIARTQTPQARLLTDVVTSVKLGLAPPVAFPTETVYGLGADATNHVNISGIFAAKGRPSDNPLIVHVASKEHLERLTGEPIPAVYNDLVKDYWPGPLTILVPVPKKSVFADNVHPGQNTIGFRVPSSKYARFLISATDKPIAGPSANSSGKPSPTTAQHVMEDLKGKINFILDGGSCDIGVESTVVDGLHDPPLILRPGGVSQNDLIAHGKKHNNVWTNTAIGYKEAHQSNGIDHNQDQHDDTEAPRAPGMKYKHYAPTGKLILLMGENSQSKVKTELDSLVKSTSHTSTLTIAILPSTTWSPFGSLPLDSNHIDTGTDVDVPIPTSSSSSALTASSTDSSILPQPPKTTKYQSHTIHSLSLGHTPKQVAQSLFATLRTCDQLHCDYIIAEAPMRPKEEQDVDVAVDMEMDYYYDAVIERMRKAASMVIE